MELLTMTKRAGFGEEPALIRGGKSIACSDYMPPVGGNGKVPKAKPSNGSPQSKAHVSLIPIIRSRQEPHGRFGLVSRKRERRLKNNMKGKRQCLCQFCKMPVVSTHKRKHEDACRCNPENFGVATEECMYCGAECTLVDLNEHEAACAHNPDVILTAKFAVA